MNTNIEKLTKTSKCLYIISSITLIITLIFSIVNIVINGDIYEIFPDLTGGKIFNLVMLIIYEIIITFCTIKVDKDIARLYKPENYKAEFIMQFVLSSPITMLIFSLLFFQLRGAAVFGYTYGITLIFYMPARIIHFIVFYQKTKTYRKDMKNKKIIDNKNKIIIEKQNKVNSKAKELIDNVGTQFFIKYYNQLKNNSIADIIDCIEENYSENAKKERITSAKSIFDNNLQLIVLKEIISNPNSILNDDLKEKAKNIYEHEKK